MTSVLRLNPVLEREMRERVRGTRSVVLLTLFLALVVGFFSIVYLGDRAVNRRDTGGLIDPLDVARLGRTCFEATIIFLMVLVLFIVPGLTASAIAGERERQTLVPMQITLLRPRQIVLGKVQASLAYLALLLVSSVPVLAICYVIGGVSVGEILRGLLALLLIGILVACIGVGASAVMRKTQAANALAYLVVLLLTIGSPIAYGIVGVAAPQYPDARKLVLLVNPVMATSTILGGEATVDSPFRGLRETIAPSQSSFDRFGPQPMPAVAVTGPGGGPDLSAIDPLAGIDTLDATADREAQRSTDIRNFGLGSAAILAAIAALCVVMASRRITTPAETER